MLRLCAVVVTYEPDERLLSRLLLALAPQVSLILVVNNGCALPLSDLVLRQQGHEVLHLQTNAGVAAALNAGFRWAQAQAAEFVITFDQDSEPAPDMVLRMLHVYRGLVAAGNRVGAVGPQQVDRRTGRRAPFMAPIHGRRRPLVPVSGKTVEVDHLISSGCLVPLAAWEDAGAFLEPLFIDYVDIEWSLRLRHRGWHLYGVGGATLGHSIGDDLKHWGGRQIPWHSPLRHYYLFRNAVHLQKLPHISLGWKFSDGLQLLKKLLFFSLVGRPRAARLRAMLRGLRPG
jgi:rhamnosyltransferase